MRPVDLPDVMLIERRSFGAPWEESTFRGLMRRPSATLTVAELDGRVVGFAVLWFAADEGELGDLAVLPEERGRGIGTDLLDQAILEARNRGCRFLYLEVREGNPGAQRLYERAGFEVVGVRKDYYSTPTEDAIVMRLEVQDLAR
jgi:ribosomal-protein-alanine N-acetyltransferase